MSRDTLPSARTERQVCSVPHPRGSLRQDIADELDRTAAESELLAAARALLEARDDQMITSGFLR